MEKAGYARKHKNGVMNTCEKAGMSRESNRGTLGWLHGCDDTSELCSGLSLEEGA
jgi:hypothetical protein